jgi:hypothetical protein
VINCTWLGEETSFGLASLPLKLFVPLPNPLLKLFAPLPIPLLPNSRAVISDPIESSDRADPGGEPGSLPSEDGVLLVRTGEATSAGFGDANVLGCALPELEPPVRLVTGAWNRCCSLGSVVEILEPLLFLLCAFLGAKRLLSSLCAFLGSKKEESSFLPKLPPSFKPFLSCVFFEPKSETPFLPKLPPSFTSLLPEPPPSLDPV